MMDTLEDKIKRATKSWEGVDVDRFMEDMRGRDPRGGARPGSGRKPVDPEEKRVQLVVTIARETKEKLIAISRTRRKRIGRVIDEMVKGEW